MPYDLETTRVHSWNLGVQHQIGDSIGVSASYLGNYLMNVWGDVTGNPGMIPAVYQPTGPCTLRNPAAPGGTQTYPNCSAAPIDVRREMTQANPAVGQYIGYLDWVTDYGWQRYHGLLLSFQRRSVNGISASANYTLVDVPRPHQPGRRAVERRHRLYASRVAYQSAGRCRGTVRC